MGEPMTKKALAVKERDVFADLHPDILKIIFHKLSADPRYFYRFQAVCKNWETFIHSLNEPPSKFPYLLNTNNLDAPLQGLTFYSIATSETGTIHIPESYHAMSFHGTGYSNLLFTSAEKGICLLNPLSGARFLLPKQNDSVCVHSLVSGQMDLVQSNICILSRIMGNFESGGWTPMIYNMDSATWTHISIETEICGYTCSVCCWDGRLYATEEASATGVYDARTGEKLYEVPAPSDEVSIDDSVYLMESHGAIFRVSRYFNNEDGCEDAQDCSFDIYRLHSEGGLSTKNYSWVEVTELKDEIIFLDDEVQGFVVKAPCGQEGNSIFFILDNGKPYRYDIGTSKVELVPCPFERCAWFVPN